jgi:hypothetical protein
MIHQLRRKLAVAVGTTLMLACCGLFRAMIDQPPPVVPGTTATHGEPFPDDDHYRRLILGTWEDNYQGKRTVTLCDDGTGIMIVELSGLKATLFSSRLSFDMEWVISEGRLQLHSLGGEPNTQVTLILATFGNRVDQSILQLDEEQLVLLDEDGETKYNWRRVLP